MSAKCSSNPSGQHTENPIKIGIVRGEENMFPERLVAVINQKARLEQLNLYAEFMMIGGTLTDQGCDYSVVLDRVSHKLPFLRTILKNAALNGTQVINNPFNDGFYNPFFCLSLAANLGMQIPKTMVLPSRIHPDGTSARTMRNIIFPLDWKSYFKSIGFPCWLKPALNKIYFENIFVSDTTDFFKVYDSTGDVAFMIQEHLQTDRFYEVYYVAGSDAIISQSNSGAKNSSSLTSQQRQAINQATKKLCKTLGFEINRVDFAIKDNDLYVVDALNPVPDVENELKNEEDMNSFVDAVVKLLFKKVDEQTQKNSFKRAIQNPNDLIAVS